ncbi:MAG: PEP-CTERM sorting domain-containing protein [Planctomycetota bacterium]
MKYRFLLVALVLGACLLPAAEQAWAQKPDVAIVAAASSTLTDPRFTDPQAKLLGTGQFNSVTIVDCITKTPTLAELLAYDAVITWSNTNYFSGEALGNVLADYVDAGGGVVVAVYANSTTTANRYLAGRWITGGYEVIPSRSGTTTGQQFLGTILVPGHPIMQGVNTFDGGTSSARPTTVDVTAGSTKIAQWTDGKTLVAVGANPHRVDLGMYPPSNAVSSGFWNQTTDGAILMANALTYSIPEPATLALLGLGLVLARRR